MSAAIGFRGELVSKCFSHDFENSLLPYDYVTIRNQGEDQKHKEKGLEAWRVSEGRSSYMKVQYNSTSSTPRNLEIVYLRLDVQTTYEVRFRPFTYG